jgi:hypothetical protein
MGEDRQDGCHEREGREHATDPGPDMRRGQRHATRKAGDKRHHGSIALPDSPQTLFLPLATVR